MELAARRWSTAGFATVTLVGATVVAVPVAAPPSALADLQAGAVRLIAAEDISWDQLLQTASADVTDISNHFSPAPFVDLQQFAANLPDYLDGTRSFTSDLTTAANAALNPFTPVDPESDIYSSLDTTPSQVGIDAVGLHLFDIGLPGKAGLLDILTNGLKIDLGLTTVTIPVLSDLVGSTEAAQIEPYLDFAGSPLSGILWGGIGTTLSPLLQFNEDVTGITAALGGTDPNYPTALDDVANMPANLTNAFLNGFGDYDIDTLLSDLGVTPPATDVALDVDLGGLLSPAGSLIDGVGLTDTLGDCSLACGTFDVPTTAVGPIASLFEMDQAVAESIGWDGVGAPFTSLPGEFTSLF
jgi:hypothetical protein